MLPPPSGSLNKMLCVFTSTVCLWMNIVSKVWKSQSRKATNFYGDQSMFSREILWFRLSEILFLELPGPKTVYQQSLGGWENGKKWFTICKLAIDTYKLCHHLVSSTSASLYVYSVILTLRMRLMSQTSIMLQLYACGQKFIVIFTLNVTENLKNAVPERVKENQITSI